MPPKKRRVRPKKKKLHILLILLLIAAGVFFFFEEPDIPRQILNIFRPEATRPAPEPETAFPELPLPGALPKVSIVIDDLGPNKKLAMDVLTIDAHLTLSILPQEVYSAWIADEGYNIGRDIIVHLPMEATRPLRLGNGGLYTWMTDEEIAGTLEEDISSVPHIIGASSHMGSAFTRDERVMNVVVSELKKQRLFFLDSVTTPKTVGYKLARSQGVRAFRRDVFLDDSNDPRDIEIQWKRLVRIARKRGYAIAQAHPRKNTLEFLHSTLRNNNEVQVVPLSELPE